MKKSVNGKIVLFLLIAVSVIIVLTCSVYAFSFSDVTNFFNKGITGKAIVVENPNSDKLIVAFANKSIFSASVQNDKLVLGDILYKSTPSSQSVYGMIYFNGGVLTAFSGGGVYYSPDGKDLGLNESGKPGDADKTRRVYSSLDNKGVNITYLANYKDGILAQISNGTIYYSKDVDNLIGSGAIVAYNGKAKVSSIVEYKGGVLTVFTTGSSMYYSPDGLFLGGGGATSRASRISTPNVYYYPKVNITSLLVNGDLLLVGFSDGDKDKTVWNSTIESNELVKKIKVYGPGQLPRIMVNYGKGSLTYFDSGMYYSPLGSNGKAIALGGTDGANVYQEPSTAHKIVYILSSNRGLSDEDIFERNTETLEIYFPLDQSSSPLTDAYSLLPTCDPVNIYPATITGTAGTGVLYVTTSANGGAYKLNGVDSFFESTGTNWIGSNPKYQEGSDCVFEKVNDKLVIDNSKVDKELTLSVWVKLDSYPNEKYEIVQKYNSYGIKVLTDGSVVSYIWGDRAEEASGTKLELNTWYQIAMTFDGSTKKLYINGVEEKSQDVVMNIPNEVNYAVRIGAGNDGSNGLSGDILNGSVDEIRLYNKALTADEVKKLSWTKYIDFSGLPSTFVPKTGVYLTFEGGERIDLWGTNGEFCYYTPNAKWTCADKSGWALPIYPPKDFKPITSCITPFGKNDGKAYDLWDASGIWYRYDEKLSGSWHLVTGDEREGLPEGFVPTVCYAHPFASSESGWAVNLWDASGDLYYNSGAGWVEADKSGWGEAATLEVPGDLPKDFIPVVGYYNPFANNGEIKGAITLISSTGTAYYYNPNTKTYRLDPKEDWDSVGLSNDFVPSLGYYHEFGSNGGGVDLWKSNTVFEWVPGVSVYVNYTLGEIIPESGTKQINYDSIPEGFNPNVGFYFKSDNAETPLETVWLFDGVGNMFYFDIAQNKFVNGRTSFLADLGLPASFKPVVGYVFPFEGIQSAIHLWDANGQLYMFNNTKTSDGKIGKFYNATSKKTGTSGKLPRDFKPVVGYYHNLAGGRINLIDVNGQFYSYNPTDIKWYNRTNEQRSIGLPSTIKAVTGYNYLVSSGDVKRKIDLWDEDGKYYVYNGSNWLERSQNKLLVLGIPLDAKPTVGYYHYLGDANGVATVDLWIGNKLYQIKDGETEFSVKPVGTASTQTAGTGFCSPIESSGYLNPIPATVRVQIGSEKKYCDPETLTYKNQLTGGQACYNDFQCLSNMCYEGHCEELVTELKAQGSLLQRIWCWITNIGLSDDYNNCLTCYGLNDTAGECPSTAGE